jgi:acyl transferase domain-containing protein
MTVDYGTVWWNALLATGPSCAIDCSWTSGHLNLQQACKAIRDGECDAALVVAANIARFSETCYALKELGLLSKDTTTRCFDENGELTRWR